MTGALVFLDLKQNPSFPQACDWLLELKTRDLFIGLDRDGTLVPIQSDPALATISPEVQTTVLECAHLGNVTVSIVSARSIRTLIDDFGTDKVILAGNYGLELRFADGSSSAHPSTLGVRPILTKVKEEIENSFYGCPIILEDHGHSLCLHFHKLKPSEITTLQESIKKLINSYRELHFRLLPTSYEILPVAAWDKGNALELISEKLSKARNPFYIFVGDSLNDEPAFSWVNENGGLSIRVGLGEETHARYRLESPSAVLRFLKDIVQLRRKSDSARSNY